MVSEWEFPVQHPRMRRNHTTQLTHCIFQEDEIDTYSSWNRKFLIFFSPIPTVILLTGQYFKEPVSLISIHSNPYMQDAF